MNHPRNTNIIPAVAGIMPLPHARCRSMNLKLELARNDATLPSAAQLGVLQRLHAVGPQWALSDSEMHHIQVMGKPVRLPLMHCALGHTHELL